MRCVLHLRLRRLMRVQQRLALEFGLPGQVAMEQQMACGLGMCFCCVRDFNVNGEISAAGSAAKARYSI